MSGVLAAGMAAPSWLAPTLFGAALVLLVAAFVRRQYVVTRRGDDSLITPGVRAAARRAWGSKGEQTLRATMADAEELAGRLAAMIDAAAARAQQTLAALEERIEALERLDQGRARSGRQEAEGPSPAPSPPPPSLNPTERRILDLAAQGRTAVEIAKETGRPTGQVELIIALRAPRPDRAAV